ncbi:MAG: tetratricopeptide repeat protein [Planctomycetales bacterium]
MDRRLAAILAYDAVGYSIAMSRDEAGTLEALKSHRREIIDPKADQHNGRTIKLMGDGALMEFTSVVNAVTFAVAMQCAMAEQNSELPEEQRRFYRIGINVGDVVIDGDDIYGDGVNIAARLEGLAEPGGICIHQNVQDQLRGKLDLDLDDLGEVKVKNIEQPIRAFHVVLNEKATAIAARPVDKAPEPKTQTRIKQAAMGILLALIFAVGFVWWQSRAPVSEPASPEAVAQKLPTKPSIAVLAFDDLSFGKDQGFLSDAIGEGIITELSRFSELFVIARNSSFKYSGKAMDVRDIAKELGVHYVLEGSQQKSGNSLRLTIQLIDALTGNHILAETYDRDLADIFAMPDEIVRAVASRIGGEIAFRAPPTGGLARLTALEYHLKSRKLLRRWEEKSLKQAIVLNLKAIEVDPTSSAGYLGLSFAYAQAHSNGWLDLSRGEALKRARESAEKALELDPDNYNAHYARGAVHVQAGEQDQAIARHQKSIDLNPSATNVMASMSEPLVFTGRVEEAIKLLQRAMRLDPHHPDYFYWNLGWAQATIGDCDAALKSMLSMSRLPNMANRTLARIYVCLGRQEEAKATIAKLLEKKPGYSITDARRNMQARYSSSELERIIGALRAAGLPE